MDLKSLFDRAAQTVSHMFSNEARLFSAGLLSAEDLEQLKSTMLWIRALIQDFEENRSSISQVDRFRLKELKDVAFDAEDTLGEFEYLLHAKALDMTEAGPSRKRKIFSVEEQQLADKADKIKKKFDEINSVWENLRLRETDGYLKSGVDKKKSVPSSSLFHKSDVFGRVDDKEKVIDMILVGNEELCTVSILPIVGMAGIGKTTLAQLVFNDQRIRDGFDLYGWVFVGGNFDVKTITKNIIVTLTNKNCDLTELNEVHKKLVEVVRGKRFFLVLDDVCNDTPGAWGTLLAPLVRAESGRIITTGHYKQVAKIRQTRSFYPLGYLPPEDCWSIFRQLVFGGEGKRPCPELMKIGRSIVEKCKGLPLAVKAIGTALLHENGEEKWKEILASGLWELNEAEDVISPAIKLSYDRMPTQLKQCFGFFSLFPKGHLFSKERIIRLWMSMGLLEMSQNEIAYGNMSFHQILLQLESQEFDRTPECAGSRCVRELLQFSFIETLEELEVFSLNDIIHGFAESIASEDAMRMDKSILNRMMGHTNEDVIISEVIRKARYLSVICNMESFICLRPTLKELKKLRVLQFMGCNNNFSNISITNEVFQNLTHLRALDFSNIVIKTLPESINNLIHLRYLVLKNTGIEKLPETMCSLYNLQTLDLMSCPIQELPRGMKNLIKLRHLIFENSHYISMPLGIGQLKALRTLPRFDIGMLDRNCGLSELHELNNLVGELCIGGLENVESAEEAVAAEIQRKKVSVLRLDWSSGEPGQYNHQPRHLKSKIHDHLFENLKPNSFVKELYIHKYCGSEFPSWLGDAYFDNLVQISIVSVPGCESLPSLGQLPHLQTLLIQSLGSVQFVGPEFSYSDRATKGFPELEYLEFCDMPKWVEWLVVQNMEFSSLKTLRIIDCPKLTSLPQLLFCSLTKLVIKDCDQLTMLRSLPSVESLTLKGRLNEKMFSHFIFPSLKILKICYSNNIRSFGFSSSQDLLLVEVLVIHSCRNLKSVNGFGNLKSLKLFKVCACHNVNISMNEEIPPSLQQLHISDCRMLHGWELFHKKKHLLQLQKDGGARADELEALAELSEADSEDDADVDANDPY